MSRTHHRNRATVAAGLALLLVGGACSSDTDTPEATPEASAPAESAPGEAEASSQNSINVTATDYAFVDLPATIEAGTTISLANVSEVELHEFVALRLPDDEERSVAEILQLPQEEMAAFFPLVTSVIITPPGAPAGMVVEGSATLTEPGRYAVLCAIPTGVDPDVYMAAAAESEGGPPDVEGGPPHFVNGMWAELAVTAS